MYNLKNNIKEEIKEITLYETPEADEAIKLLQKAQQKQIGIKIIAIIGSIILTGIDVALFFIPETKGQLIGFSIFLLSVILIFNIALFINLNGELKPYKKLLKIAEHNDEIRHEERVRENERQRIRNSQNKEKYATNKIIEKTLKKIPPKKL